MQREEILSDAIFAAFCAYLLMAVAWAGAYVVIDALAPGSFRLADGSGDLSLPSAMYFSLVTLTTLGYGDISPVGELAQRLAVLEAFSGVLYVAVVVSRLVSAYRGPGTRSDG
jgi:voltage-gated potassium channel Kch